VKRIIQIKVCGLTEAKMAAACAALEIDAVGLVFYPKVSRYVSDVQAEEIAAAVNGRAAVIGVFVDEPADEILQKVKRVRVERCPASWPRDTGRGHAA
jgi:phosphoribosylanthranilate isomerase